MNKKKTIFMTIALFAAIMISILPAPEGLNATSMRFLGIFIAGIFLLVTNTVEDYVAFMFVAIALILTRVASFGTVFSQFATSTPWMLIMVFAFAAGIGNSGLLARVAYKILSLFPANYNGAVLALMSASVVTGPLIPSGTAKANILIPVGNQLTETLGLEDNSRGAMGLYAAVFLPSYIGSSAFTSGSAIIAALIGMMGADGAGFDMLTWFKATCVWYVVLLIGTYLFAGVFCRPKNQQQFSKEFFQEKSKTLGPMSKKEKITAAVLISVIILWSTTSITGFDTTMVGFLAVMILIVTDVMSTRDFATRVPWTLIIFIGIVMSLSSIMSETGWNAWLAENLGGIVGGITGSIWIFVPVLIVLTLALRFVIIESVTLLVMLLPVFSPFMADAGFNMFIPVFVIFITAYVLFAPYQCPGFIGVAKMADRISFREVRNTSIAYVIINFIGMMASIPLWKLMGLC